LRLFIRNFHKEIMIFLYPIYVPSSPVSSPSFSSKRTPTHIQCFFIYFVINPSLVQVLSKSNKSRFRLSLQSWTHTLYASSIDFYFVTFFSQLSHSSSAAIFLFSSFSPFKFNTLTIKSANQTQNYNKPSPVKVFQIFKMLSSHMPALFAFLPQFLLRNLYI
jgi:hypothetical protein